MQKWIGRLARVRRQTLLVATSLVALLAALSVASPALATPKGGFSVFADCPLSTAEACVYAKTETGEFTVGSKTVPIEKAITLQGGFNENSETGAETFVGASNGVTLSKTPQNVPGGLSGLVNCKAISNFLERISCELVFENGLTGVSATTELAAPASSIGINLRNILFSSGVALTLPLKVHLENPFLGSSCYVGSNSAPIVIELTTGTTSPPAPNKPISGKPGEVSFIENEEILKVSKNSLVNNSFAAPAANGCGGIFSFLIDPIIDSTMGLPAAAGHNTAILNGTLEETSSESVKASE
jgi:hypothetical protein